MRWLWLAGLLLTSGSAEAFDRFDLRHLREMNSCVGCDLSHAALQGTDLFRANLQEADLREAKLQGANLSGANLEWADLEAANLQAASLFGANLQKADLRKATLQEADLRDANLQGANLAAASLQKANLPLAKLQRAVLAEANLRDAVLFGAMLQKASLAGAALQQADLSGAKLQEASLRGAELQKINLSKAILEKADLAAAKLQKADLSGANLQEANLFVANLQEANLREANLQEANLRDTNLQGADLSGASLQKANLVLAKLQGASLAAANLREAALLGAMLQKANLLRVNLQKADLSVSNLTEAVLSLAVLEDARLAGADLSRALYQPATAPGQGFLSGLGGLPSVRFCPGEHSGLVQLRTALKGAGLRDLERQVTYALGKGETRYKLARWRQAWPEDGWPRWPCGYPPPIDYGEVLEGAFRLVFFEWTTDYGLHYGRPLFILLGLIGVFTLLYLPAVALSPWRSGGDSGIYRIWPRERIERDRNGLTAADDIAVERVWSWGLAAFGQAFYFSLVSAFHIGWRDLNVGSWIARMQPREYALRAKGWVRVVSGLQSLISVYLIAMWALTYFGRPFE